MRNESTLYESIMRNKSTVIERELIVRLMQNQLTEVPTSIVDAIYNLAKTIDAEVSEYPGYKTDYIINEITPIIASVYKQITNGKYVANGTSIGL